MYVCLYVCLCRVYLRRGDIVQSQSLLRQALRLYLSVYGERARHVNIASVYHQLGTRTHCLSVYALTIYALTVCLYTHYTLAQYTLTQSLMYAHYH